MKNFQDYKAEKYAGPDYQKVEEGIYYGPNPYWRPDRVDENLFVTSLTFEMEPGCYGEEGGCPQHITQIPFENILDDFSVFITDFYDDLNRDSPKICYQEFGSRHLENIRNLRALIGKRFFAVPCDPDDEDSEEEDYKIIIE